MGVDDLQNGRVEDARVFERKTYSIQTTWKRWAASRRRAAFPRRGPNQASISSGSGEGTFPESRPHEAPERPGDPGCPARGDNAEAPPPIIPHRREVRGLHRVIKKERIGSEAAEFFGQPEDACPVARVRRMGGRRRDHEDAHFPRDPAQDIRKEAFQDVDQVLDGKAGGRCPDTIEVSGEVRAVQPGAQLIDGSERRSEPVLGQANSDTHRTGAVNTGNPAKVYSYCFDVSIRENRHWSRTRVPPPRPRRSRWLRSSGNSPTS